MYVWVILATFLAMLASYALSVRPDMRELTVAPMAEAALGELMVQHRALKNYVYYLRCPFVDGCDEDYRTVGFDAGVVDLTDLEEEAPLNYTLSGQYTSQIFCLAPGLNAHATTSDGGNPCNIDGGVRYMITYGSIPEKWVNLGTDLERPNLDLMNAMRNMTSSASMLGYTAPAEATEVADADLNPTASTVRLMSKDGSYGPFDNFVPKIITEDGNFMDKCNLAEGKVCLVYMGRL